MTAATDGGRHVITSHGDTGGAGRALLFFGLALALLGIAAAVGIGYGQREPGGWLFGAFLFLPGVVMVLAGRRSRAVGRRFEPGVLEVDSPTATLGSTLQGRFRRTVKTGSTDVRRIDAQLLLQEWVRWQQGTDTRTATKDLHTYPVQVRPHPDPLAVVADVSLRFPAYPPSFRSRNNEVRWHLIVEIEMADGFTEDSILPLWVVPAIRGSDQQPVTDSR